MRHFDRWAEGIGEPDAERVRESSVLDFEAATFRRDAELLRPFRRRRALRVLAAIYGPRSMRVAELYPDPNEAANSVIMRLFTPSSWLAVDGEPGPLRRRGAWDVHDDDHRQLRAAYKRLKRV